VDVSAGIRIGNAAHFADGLNSKLACSEYKSGRQY